MYDTNITPIEQLRQYSAGQVVELPPFAEGQPFRARLKRPSLLGLLSRGRIPNELINTASNLFNGKTGTDGNQEVNDTYMTQMFEVLDLFCEECFVEPSYLTLKENGVELTDEQILFVFNYSQAGVRVLQTFRGESAGVGSDQHGDNISGQTVLPISD